MSDEADVKQVIDLDLHDLEDKLQNGHGGDPELHGIALAKILRHVRVLIKRQTVTDSECAARRQECMAAMNAAAALKAKAEADAKAEAKTKAETDAAKKPGTTVSTVMTHLLKDAPPWAIVVYLYAKSNGWIQ